MDLIFPVEACCDFNPDPVGHSLMTSSVPSLSYRCTRMGIRMQGLPMSIFAHGCAFCRRCPTTMSLMSMSSATTIVRFSAGFTPRWCVARRASRFAEVVGDAV